MKKKKKKDWVTNMLSVVDYKFFDKARKVAMVSDYPKIHVGCVAVYQGQIIGMGCNSNKTHPKQKFYNKFRQGSDDMLPKLHAEINCINQIKGIGVNFSKVKLYIYRIGNDRDFRMARPCLSCMAAIKDLGIKDIYYTTNDGYSFESLAKIETGGVA